MESSSAKPGTIVKLAFIGLFAGAINGLFGSGGGMIVVPALIFLMKIEDHKAHATAIMIILPITLVSSYLYLTNGAVDFGIAWKVIAGGLAGGFIGAWLLNKLPKKYLRLIFGLFIIASAVRLLVK
jgi:uncharacterized membrane protein YfcA